MGEVPLRGTHVRHRLHDAIFWFEICTKTVGEVSDLMKTRKKALNAPRARIRMGSFGRNRIGGGFR